MGTSSITHIYEMPMNHKNENVNEEYIVCSCFRHWDGYPSNHGQNLVDFLKNKKLVNGIGGNFNKDTMYNRAGTMAVKLMNHIQDLSGCEVVPPNTNWDVDYTYHIYYNKHVNKFYIKVCDTFNDNSVKVFVDNYNSGWIDIHLTDIEDLEINVDYYYNKIKRNL
jgi:hypothetical protein